MSDHLGALERVLSRRHASGQRVHAAEDVARLSRQLLFLQDRAGDENQYIATMMEMKRLPPDFPLDWLDR